MTKKIRKSELSEDELDCVTGGASGAEEDAPLLMAKPVAIVPVSAVASKSKRVLPKSVAGQAQAAQTPKGELASPLRPQGNRPTNVNGRIKTGPGK